MGSEQRLSLAEGDTIWNVMAVLRIYKTGRLLDAFSIQIS